MTASFLAVPPERHTEIQSFLLRAFDLPVAPTNLSDEVLAWKYYAPHPWFPPSRSLILETEAGIAAHACIAPVRFVGSNGPVDSGQIIDWASAKLIPGGGLLLYRRALEKCVSTLLAIGGSEDARQIFPQVRWFKRTPDMRYHARPLRSSRYLAHTSKNLRDFLRLGRNLHWQILPRLPGAQNWTCRTAHAGEDVFTPSGKFTAIVRTRAWFDYLLNCPLGRNELIILERDGKPLGHAFVADRAGSFLVADFVAPFDDETAAFAALVRYIASKPEAAEVVAASSLPEKQRVFEACGLRFRKTVEVYLADPRKLLPADRTLEINPLIGDAFYLSDPAYPFTC